jgi:hypothetical protein
MIGMQKVYEVVSLNAAASTAQPQQITCVQLIACP